MLSSFTASTYSLFSYKSDYASLILSDAAFVSLTTLYYKMQYLLDCTNSALSLLFTSVFSSVSSTTVSALVIAFKFLVLIALLIFIRGGIPRYRFDHLTKIG
jgi:NADH:ubiquinone oxidoreductase subunit H